MIQRSKRHRSLQLRSGSAQKQNWRPPAFLQGLENCGGQLPREAEVPGAVSHLVKLNLCRKPVTSKPLKNRVSISPTWKSPVTTRPPTFTKVTGLRLPVSRVLVRVALHQKLIEQPAISVAAESFRNHPDPDFVDLIAARSVLFHGT